MTQPFRLAGLTADYNDDRHAQALVNLLDAYARDPVGGAAQLCRTLPKHTL